MKQTNAILCLQSSASAGDMPIMLHELLFCPILTWVCRELTAQNVQHFFIVCDPKWKEAALAAAPEGAVVCTRESEAVRAVKGTVIVSPSAVVPVASFSGSPVYTAQSGDLNKKDLSAVPEKAGHDLDWMPIRGMKELQRAGSLCRELLNARWMSRGVTIVDGANTYIDPRCRIAAGTRLLPGTILRGETVIGADCEIGPNTMIRDCTIGDGCTVNASQLNESTIQSRTTVGPFAYIRPGCSVGSDCRIGDFVELKNSTIGSGTKVSHLTYVGDSDVGEKVNFGCGTVTTNYDGKQKYRCTIGDNVFLGCNTNLVAPVTVESGAYTAAGSTITEDVPADALAVARARQTVKPRWAAKFRKK